MKMTNPSTIPILQNTERQFLEYVTPPNTPINSILRFTRLHISCPEGKRIEFQKTLTHPISSATMVYIGEWRLGTVLAKAVCIAEVATYASAMTTQGGVGGVQRRVEFYLGNKR